MTMYRWASPEWFAAVQASFARMVDEIGDVQETYGFTAQYVIEDAPDGTVRYIERVEDRLIVFLGLGEADDADVVLTMPYSGYKRLFTELLSSHQLPSCRMEGDGSKLAPAVVTRGMPEYQQHKERARDFTIWPDD